LKNVHGSQVNHSDELFLSRKEGIYPGTFGNRVEKFEGVRLYDELVVMSLDDIDVVLSRFR
jgi:hypothetical protein